MSGTDRRLELIWIIGYMASGKSTIGRLLAGRMGAVFTDADAWIEAQAGQTVPRLFEREGETAFRAWESRFVETLLATAGGKHVVACGGGLPCYNSLITSLKASGTVVYLAASVETLAQRLIAAPDMRPLVKDLTEETLLHDIRLRLESRVPVYEQAHLTVCVDKKTPEIIVEELLANLGSAIL